MVEPLPKRQFPSVFDWIIDIFIFVIVPATTVSVSKLILVKSSTVPVIPSPLIVKVVPECDNTSNTPLLLNINFFFKTQRDN